MGKILVLYDSQSGNTRKMAEQVAAGASSAPGTEVRCLQIDQAGPEDLLWCDGIALGGSGTNAPARRGDESTARSAASSHRPGDGAAARN